MTEGTWSGEAPATKDAREIFEVERVAALAKLFDADDPTNLGELAGPIYWPDLSPSEAEQEWYLLRAWVDQLVLRFSHLDHHVIPRCWFRHNGHVEALAAFRDQETANYSDTGARALRPWSGTTLFVISRLVCASGPVSWPAELFMRPQLDRIPSTTIPTSGTSS